MLVEGIGGPAHPGPTRFSAVNAAGASIEVMDVNTHTLRTVGSTPRNAYATKTGAQLNVARQFSNHVGQSAQTLLPVPIASRILRPQ